MLVVHSRARSFLSWQEVEVWSSVGRLAYLCMVSPVNVVLFPFSLVVLGVLHEGLRVVLHSVIGPAAPRCGSCHCDETDCETEDPGDGAPDRRPNSGGKAVVTSDGFGPVDREIDHVVRRRRPPRRTHVELGTKALADLELLDCVLR